MTASLRRGAGSVLAGVAFWPVWRWVYARLTDGTSETVGLVSWSVAVVVLAGITKRDAAPATADSKAPSWIPTWLVLAYTCAVLADLVPPIVRAGLALSAITAIVSSSFLRRPFSAPLWSLLLLGLPIEATLQFYLGYPLRFVSTEIAAGMLRAMSLGVEASGTRLVYGVTEVIVDAPCSGLSALRVGLISCSALVLARGGRTRDWLVAGALTVAMAVVANAVRSASLFLSETSTLGLRDLGDWLHSAIGVVLFACVLGAQIYWVHGTASLAKTARSAP